jgi:uncharacterized protein (TIGR03435 family)
VAYGVKDFQILGAPAWFRFEKYDLMARAYRAPDLSHLKLLMQPLLAERFKLALHRETRTMPVFARAPKSPGSMPRWLSWQPI